MSTKAEAKPTETDLTNEDDLMKESAQLAKEIKAIDAAAKQGREQRKIKVQRQDIVERALVRISVAKRHG